MTPVIVSVKVAAILVAGVAACLDHASPAAHGNPIAFAPGWESCPAILAIEARTETQDEASAQAAAEAKDRHDYDNAVKAAKALGVKVGP